MPPNVYSLFIRCLFRATYGLFTACPAPPTAHSLRVHYSFIAYAAHSLRIRLIHCRFIAYLVPYCPSTAPSLLIQYLFAAYSNTCFPKRASIVGHIKRPAELYDYGARKVVHEDILELVSAGGEVVHMQALQEPEDEGCEQRLSTQIHVSVYFVSPRCGFSRHL